MDVAYKLYQAALSHLDIPLPPSSHECARLRDPFLSQPVSAVKKLVHVLADMHGDIAVSLDDSPTNPAADSVFEFLFLGVQHVSAMNLSLAEDGPSRVYCITCNLLRRTRNELPQLDLCQAELLDSLAVLYEREIGLRLPIGCEESTEPTPEGGSRVASVVDDDLRVRLLFRALATDT